MSGNRLNTFPGLDVMNGWTRYSYVFSPARCRFHFTFDFIVHSSDLRHERRTDGRRARRRTVSGQAILLRRSAAPRVDRASSSLSAPGRRTKRSANAVVSRVIYSPARSEALSLALIDAKTRSIACITAF